MYYLDILFIKIIDANTLSKGDFNISKVFLCGSRSFNDEKHTSILTVSIEYII